MKRFYNGWDLALGGGWHIHVFPAGLLIVIGAVVIAIIAWKHR